MTLIQRFGSAANLNIHLHGLVLDGVYRPGEAGPTFHAAAAPTPQELEEILSRIIRALLTQLTRSGHLVEEAGVQYLDEPQGGGASDPGLAALQWASCTYRIAFGPRAGQAVVRGRGALQQPDSAKPGCVTRQGFSLHAGIRCAAHQRRELERLCRYIGVPSLLMPKVTVGFSSSGAGSVP